jgi:hypothetical protein
MQTFGSERVQPRERRVGQDFFPGIDELHGVAPRNIVVGPNGLGREQTSARFGALKSAA